MAKITLKNLSHSYLEKQNNNADWALRDISIDWKDSGAYALLGPSGCGKTTLLNIVSGLLKPTKGNVLFDDKDVTTLNPVERDIAQIFQFPVIYDTMSVYDNLAFPLKNRGLSDGEIASKVKEIAEMLELTSTLKNRASGLTADGKQKISLGRGLVRSDVNVIMFDEPLTVIDPHLKWVLRSKLKELHQKINRTMIYVTHDQTEAMTLANDIVVLDEGIVSQKGSPMDLYNDPNNLFVGGFIGSPKMNFISTKITSKSNDKTEVDLMGSSKISIPKTSASASEGDAVQLGIRPEHLIVNQDGDGSWESKVFVVEKLGSGTFLYLEKEGEPLVVETEGDSNIKVGDTVKVGFSASRCHLFDSSQQAFK
jgi:glycerol transport system ATP-binding protein